MITLFLSAVLFLTPLFFLPFTVSPVGLNKQAFFLAAAAVGLGLLFVKIIREEKLVFRFSWIYAALLFLAAAVSASFVLSRAMIEGLRSEALPLALLPFAGYLIFAFLFGISAREKKDYKMIFWSFILSAVAASLFEIYLLAAPIFLGAKYLLPWDFARSLSFTPLGLPNALAIFAAAAFFGLVSYYSLVKIFWKEKICSFLCGLPLLAVLLLVNFSYVWIVLAIFVFILLLIRLSLRSSTPKSDETSLGDSVAKAGEEAPLRSFVPLIVLLILFLFMAASGGQISLAGKIFGASFPVEYFPDFNLSLKIIKSVWNESVPRLFFGSGGGTFKYFYDASYPAELNETAFWNVRFDQGYSAAMTFAAEAGLLGVLSLFAILSCLVYCGVKILRENEDSDFKRAKLAGFLLVSFLAAFLFLYRANFSLLVLFFSLLGVFASLYSYGKKEIALNFSFVSSLKNSIFVLLILILIPAAILYFFYFQTNRYLAALDFASGLKIYNEKSDADAAADLLNKAAVKDYWNDDYSRNLAQARLNQLNAVLARPLGPDGKMDKQTESLLGGLADAAIQAGRYSVSLNPADALNFQALGKTYEGLILLVNNAADFALEAYQKSAELAPKNPSYLLDKGRLSLVLSDNLGNQIAGLKKSPDAKSEDIAALEARKRAALSDAENYLKKAAEMKKNYSEAKLVLAQIYDREGWTNEAVKFSEEAVLANPEGMGELFELGYLYYKGGRYSDAKIVFQKLVNLYPTYSNGRYFLGLIYDKEGNKQKAIAEFEILVALNPENAEVKRILENLKAGRAAFEAEIPPSPVK